MKTETEISGKMKEAASVRAAMLAKISFSDVPLECEAFQKLAQLSVEIAALTWVLRK